ncbi:MAG TPA: ribosome biogenesis GTPase Der [Burkholderiaceae bacterium]|nr:ribosome biogenesis GTPase Der [Burkholderiaceae bacterium]HQR69163.1 ribosome biogenesis GTPase Der [Burkholderiaceae bacterium]
MKPVIALVGRPNVGKSTLFNRLTRSRAALVADFPGLTRDRHYGDGKVGERDYIVIDTGGFEPLNAEGIAREMAAQAEQAIAESDVIVFVLDAREGLAAQDRRIGERLRVTGRPVLLAVNKAEGLPAEAIAEFHELGLGEPHAISAAHGDGVHDLMDLALAPFVAAAGEAVEETHEEGARRVRVAVVGRPNVGKSTLINALLGEERLIAFDQPGTTRDAIEVEFEFDGRPYTLIDTAGLRRRGKVFEAVEKFSVVKTLQAIAGANVVVLLLDASSEVSDQDAHIAGYVLESGRALVIAVNKWDGLDDYQRDRIKREIDRKLHFLRWARVHTISALKRTGLSAVMRSVSEAHAAAFARLPTPKLTRALQAAVARQMPPRAGPLRPKLRYAHQGGVNPPIIVIHGNALNHVQDSYRRYLEGHFRSTFDLTGTPLRVEFRTGRNPYVA